MSYDENDEDMISVEIINTGESTHKTDVAHNVFYTGRKRTKANSRNNEEQFFKWVKSLNPNTDGIKTETHNFEYKQYTVDGKKKVND
jgi:hypothetical protein